MKDEQKIFVCVGITLAVLSFYALCWWAVDHSWFSVSDCWCEHCLATSPSANRTNWPAKRLWSSGHWAMCGFVIKASAWGRGSLAWPLQYAKLISVSILASRTVGVGIREPADSQTATVRTKLPSAVNEDKCERLCLWTPNTKQQATEGDSSLLLPPLPSPPPLRLHPLVFVLFAPPAGILSVSQPPSLTHPPALFVGQSLASLISTAPDSYKCSWWSLVCVWSSVA